MEGIPWTTVIIAVIGLISAALVARATNAKYTSEGADAITSAAVKLVGSLPERLDAAEEENERLRARIDALEQEARDTETMRYQNQHLRERVKYLELQVGVMREATQYDVDIAEMLASDRMQIAQLQDKVDALTQQVIELGGWPINTGEMEIETEE